ncbi:bacterial Ig-like domain-containing protein [Salibacterium aidingense]|uniref:bacterial Ig-like domain-containing protein n=1 Tax=Salibacterium aidingense TaxID=384933 RepID=UPI003BC17832
MRIVKQGTALSMSLLLVFSPLSALAEDVDTGEWEFSTFGSNTGESSNPDPVEEDDGSVTITAEGGKIESGSEGLSYYFKQLPSDANFEITTKATVESYNSVDGQVSFGLMLRDEAGENGDTSTQTANYVAAGGLGDEMQGFYKKGDNDYENLEPFDNKSPAPEEEFDLRIQKSGDTYLLESNGDTQTLMEEEMFSEEMTAGFYAAREAVVHFRDFNVEVNDREVTGLEIDTENMKTNYLIDEELDAEGLQVTAALADGSEEVLSAEDYIISGFNSGEAGTNTILVSYNGITEEIDLTIEELSLTSMDIKYHPAKTTYYRGDKFDPEGLTVIGEYNDGYRSEELQPEEYRLLMDGEEIGENDTFEEAGEKTVIVEAGDKPEVSTSFDIVVSDASLTGLDIRQLPEKTTYFLGDELDLDGMVVYAEYNDGSDVRLMREDMEASGLDTSEPGERQVTITHKGETAAIDVKVKEKEGTGLGITSYPKTTFETGESFSTEGLEVSRLYDNGDEEVLEEGQYTVDDSGFDSSSPGTNEITVVPEEENMEAISYDVTVREVSELEWQSIIFGQSAGDDSNSVEVLEDESSAALTAEGPSGGKITGDHDGISYYYTIIDEEEDNFELSADIQVNDYAKDPHDGQESFGIMARDAIGEDGSSSVFASNIAAVGGYSGGTMEENGTQLFARTGVESSDGAGSEGIKKIMLNDEKPGPSNTHPEEDYHLTLSKTNSGFTATLNDGEEEIIYEPDILNVQDDKVYVGFYTARKADIVVENIDMEVSAAATDPPKVEPPVEPVEPEIENLSLQETSETDQYKVRMQANVNGSVTLKQGRETIAEQEEMTAGEMKVIETTLPENTDTNFTAVFLPDDTQTLTSYDQIVTNFSVTNRTFEGDIYVAPDADASSEGTEADPVALDTAVDFVGPGQTILVTDGEYVRDEMLMIEQYHDGTEDARKTLKAVPGANPVIDFDKQSKGVELSGDYWHVEGLDFARSAGNTKGFVIGGSHNIVENSRFYEHGDTGLQISRTDPNEDDKSKWPSDNLVLNSTSFDNRDPSENNADGFAAKLTSGEGNVFRGTIAHHNIDDGWDLYTKVGTGAIGAVTIEDSIAYNNGFLTDSTEGTGDKNGFKLGGEGVNVPHVIRDSIAFNNGAAGFTSNSNPAIIAEDNISFNNAGGNLDFSTYADIEEEFELEHFVSYQKDYDAEDSYPEYLEADHNYLFDGSVSDNASGTTLSDDNFVSLEPELPYERDDQGNIVWGDFLDFMAPDGKEDSETIKADVKFTPPVLNVNGGGKATVHIELPDDYDAREIVFDSILLNEEVEPVNQPGNSQNYKVQFNRQDLADVLDAGNEAEITITGEMESGEPMEGSTVIKVKE